MPILDRHASLFSSLQTKYTVVNRDTGELYDVREIDTSMPYRYSVLPHNMRVPSKARQLLGINEQPTHVPPKAAKVRKGLYGKDLRLLISRGGGGVTRQVVLNEVWCRGGGGAGKAFL